MMEAARVNAGPDYADLHRHLGGAVHPKVLFGYLAQGGISEHESAAEREMIENVLERFPSYPDLKRHFSTRRRTLSDYLELHKLVEPLQTIEAIHYFLYRIIRGARVFEQTSLLEMRCAPFLRTDRAREMPERLRDMERVVEAIAAGARVPEYAVDVRFVLCLHTALPDEVNRATIDLALRRRDLVRGIDIAGPEAPLGDRLDHFLDLYRRAADAFLPATAHIGETSPEYIHPELFPFLRRIGHGIQIPLHRPELLPELRRRGICFELCPGTYIQTGTFPDYSPIRKVTQRLDDAGVDYCFCTDNPAFNGRYLQAEHEIALENDLIDFRGLARCQRNAFAHAF